MGENVHRRIDVIVHLLNTTTMLHQLQCYTNLEWCGEECQHQYLDRQHDTPPQPELEKRQYFDGRSK